MASNVKGNGKELDLKDNSKDLYELSCVHCIFSRVIEADIDAVFDIVEAHQEMKADSALEHFVEFECLR